MKLFFIVIFGIMYSFETQALEFYRHTGSNFEQIKESQVEGKCGFNFLFREEGVNDAPKYLAKDILKANFTGKNVPSFEALINSAKSFKGKCFWVTADEAGKLK